MNVTSDPNHLTMNEISERALLVGAIYGGMDETTVNEHLDELMSLAETAGAEVVGRIKQRLKKINPATFIGKGKAEQILHQAKELDAQLIIFDDELSPTQTKNFQRLNQDIKVIDRNTLILEIFRQHAKSRESKTQVELAHLQYILPRLTRMWTHLERQMGGIGTRAGAGETQIEVDRRLVRNRIARLKKDLVRIEKERITQGKRRQDHYRVALVGYTNAGKSTLMNTVSGADVYIEDQLFATLDTTIRSVELDNNHKILISDTVGFIRKLPHHLVASFRSTLSEVRDADLILIVLDASSHQFAQHYETIISVLESLGAHKTRSLVVLNKIDICENNGQLLNIKGKFPDGVLTSAKNQIRIDVILQKIIERTHKDYRTVDIHLPYDQNRLSAIAQSDVSVLDRNYDENGIYLKLHGSARRINKILRLIEENPR
ncbi:MAG: GTPase HflX [Candidatus Neomarinimicrobiota bacterium]